MAINLQPLPNGLRLVNTGLTIGDRSGDSLRVFATKFNDNAEISLTVNDELAGLGLQWDKTSRKLNLAVPDRNLVIGSNVIPYNIQEFNVDTSGFSLRSVPAAKIVGDLPNSTIRLTSGRTLVGNSRGYAAETSFGPEFKIEAGKIEIFNLPWSRIINAAINPQSLVLGFNRIPLGTNSGRAASIELGPDFVLSNNRLGIAKGGILVNLVNINAANAAPNKFLGISGTSTSPFLEWKPLTFEGVTITPSDNTVDLKKIKTTNKASALAQLTVTEDGKALQWYPSVNDLRQQRNYVRYLNNQQRRLNLDYARSIAELQNQTCIIFNTPIPSIYTSNVFDPVTPQFIPGNMYVTGGLSETGYDKSIETINFSNETVRILSFRGAAVGAPAGSSTEGLIRTKLNPMSVSSPSAMYIQGMGSTNGQAPLTSNLERLTYVTQVVINNGHQLARTHRGGATLYNYKKGYFVGGINSTSTTFLMDVTALDFLTDTSVIDSNAITTSAFGSTGVTQNYNQGYVFGGRNGATVFNTIIRYVLSTGTTVGVGASLGANSPHRNQACSLDDDKFAYLFNGASGFATGPENNPALDPRLDAASKFDFFAETIVRLFTVTSGTKRSSQTASGSITRGLIAGGLERVKQEVSINVWQESLANFANRIKANPTAQTLTGSPEVATAINGAATSTVNVDYTNTDVIGVRPPQTVVTTPLLTVDVVTPNRPPVKPRFNS